VPIDDMGTNHTKGVTPPRARGQSTGVIMVTSERTDLL
jgi:hypothetical protein